MDKKQIVDRVAGQLLIAEHVYEETAANLDGLERTLRLLRKTLQIREEKAQNFEETGPLDKLLVEYHTKLEQILKAEPENVHSIQLDFTEWANAIESNVQTLDSFMLSFESVAGESDSEKTRPVRIFSRRDGTLSSRSRWYRDTLPSRGATTFLQVLKSNGKFMDTSETLQQGYEREEHYFYMTTAAWTLAVVGMMITIGFLSGDFRAAQRNLAIEIERTGPTSLRLPAVTICGNPKNVPAFRDYPTKRYPGLPLFGVSQLIRNDRSGGRSERLLYLKDSSAKNSNQTFMEDVVVTTGSRFMSRARGFDVKRELKSLRDIRAAGSFESLGDSDDGNFYCVRIGKKEKEILQPFEYRNTTEAVTPSVEIRVFKSRLFSACRSKFLQRDRLINQVFISELRLFADQLEKRGILDFDGFNHSVLEESLLDLRAPYHIDFYCNVYFFSGFFYPSLDDANISYKYDPTNPSRWKKTGSGPYYSAYSWKKDAPLIIGPDTSAISNETYTLLGLRLFAQNADDADDSGAVKPSTVISVVDTTQTSTIVFQRVQVQGKIEYHVREERSFSPKTARKIVDVFQIKMDFSTFATERIRASPTMSWPEFLTDVFEFVGLFTGICIFTLIVAPAHSLV